MAYQSPPRIGSLPKGVLLSPEFVSAGEITGSVGEF